MCKKTNQNPNHKKDHQPAQKVVPDLANEVSEFNRKGKEKEVGNYLPLAKKLQKRGYSIKTFVKYWTGKQLTDQMLANLQDALDIIQEKQSPVNQQLVTEKENVYVTQ